MRKSRWNDATRSVAALALAGSITSGCVAQLPGSGSGSGAGAGSGANADARPGPDPATAELVELINAWRRNGADCDGKRLAASAALTINPLLASSAVAENRRPIEALKQRGYLASHTETVFVTGPSRPSDVLRFLMQKYCKVLSGSDVSEIGVERDGRTWHLVLARPLIASDLGDWRKAGLDVLRHANAARAVSRTCGDRRLAAAPPLAWSDTLAAAALGHSEDMARRDELSHAGGDRSNSGERATRVGYRWRVVGENIALGQGSARVVVESWLTSPGHCATLMDPRFTEMGAAYVMRPNSQGTIYWAQEFGAPH